MKDWTDKAECRKHEPSMWHSRRQGPKDQAQIICSICPVLLDCRIFALEKRLEFGPAFVQGVWGGLMPVARQSREEAEQLLKEALERKANVRS